MPNPPKPDPAEIAAAQQSRRPQADAKDIEVVLNDLDFPADQDAIVDHAQAAGADDGVLRALRALPLADYANMDEVLRSMPLAGSS